MIKHLLTIGCMLLCLEGVAFKTPFADSLFQHTRSLEPEAGIQYMLDNFYSVFSKNHEDGMEWGQQCLRFSNLLDNDFYRGRSNLALGTIWYLKGDYEKSILRYQKALSTFEDLDNQCWMGRTYNQLSVYDRKQKQYEKALQDLDRSYRLCKNCGDQTCVETSLNNRGVVYEMMGDYQAALNFYRKAQRIAEKNNNQLGLSYIFNNLAECHRLQENYDSVIFYVDKSTAIRQQSEDYTGMAMNYTNLGETLTLAGDYQNAEKYLVKAVELCEKIDYPDMKRQAYEQLFRLYKAQGKLEKATDYLDKSMRLKDSLLSVEKLKSLSEMEVKYETEKVEREYAEEKQLHTEANLKVANRNNWIILISALTLLLIFVGLLIYQRRVKRAQQEKHLAVLDEKQRGLQAVFEATEEERQRIAKDLHDGVGQQMSGLRLAWANLSQDLKKMDEDSAGKLDELGNILKDTAEDVRSISHEMMPKVLKEFGLIPALQQMLDKSFKLTNVQHDFEHFNFEGRIDERKELGVYRVAQELINNVIKHASATKVNVQLFKNKGQLILMVSDDGVGFTPEKTDGHGLLNMQSRLNTIQGEINFDSQLNEGTLVTVRVHLKEP